MAYILVMSLLLLLPLTAAKAVCPICTVAVCAGVGLSRWLGIDDTITGLWIGGLAISMIVWTIDWLNRKNIRFFGRQPLTVVAYYLFIIWPLYHYNMVGHPLNKLWGIDKTILGIIIGSIGFTLGVLIDKLLRGKNEGKGYFPFQKVAMPIGMLVILTLIFYLVCTYKLLQ
jgi:hypothetical protein